MTIPYPPKPEQVEALSVQQKGRCAICGKLTDQLVIDHDHDSMVTRGLLCNNCNTGLGMLGDSPYRMLRAAQYTAQFKGTWIPQSKRLPYAVNLCPGSHEPPTSIKTIRRGPGLFRCSSCDSSRVKVRYLGLVKGRSTYITHAHYSSEKPRGRGLGAATLQQHGILTDQENDAVAGV